MTLLMPLVVIAFLALQPYARGVHREGDASQRKDATILILGGGVAGVVAARTLHEQGIDDFKIVEARRELGGRLQAFKFGHNESQYTLELGANWVQGTETEGGPENPIWGLVKKHGVKTQDNDWTGSITTYDSTGQVDFLNIFNKSIDRLTDVISAAGYRASKQLADLSTRTAYSLVGAKPKSPQAAACE